MASQTLVSLVARLQQVMSVAQGRTILLDYARKSCGARLALLFTLDQENRALALLEHAGRHPHPSSFARENSPTDLPLRGLFASALRQQGFVNIPDISRNPLSLPEERAYAWPHGRVLLHALRQGQRQGVVVFCFSPAGARTVPGEQAQDELLICVSLLSAYLIKEEEYQPVRRIPAAPQRSRRSAKRSPAPKKVKSTQVEESEEPPALQVWEVQALLEQERSRIAREMHDSVLQDVGHVLQKLEYTQRILEKQPQAALNEVEQARVLLSRSLRDLRYGISSLLPIPLEEQEFDEALKSLLHEYSQGQPHLKIVYDTDNLTLWPQSLQAPIYRFMQEALNNIRKHAAASEVRIRIRQVAGLGFVQVSDNGQGFAPAQARTIPANSENSIPHLGLQAMEERIRQAGGVLE
ncbi:MAG: sensor histidine kinase, partial [Ktedonobacteraceae bacterium]